MPPEFLKTNVDLRRNFIRGAARLLVCTLDTPFPILQSDIVRKTTATQNELQTITISGTPTGGTFTLSFKGYTTAAIAYNAVAATVQAALQALSSIGTNGVTVAGGPGPGTPYTVTFVNQLGGQNVPSLTGAHAFTGGTTPGIAVVTTTAGFGQYDAQAAYTDLGATKGGVRILRNNSEETFDVDQIQADIMSMPTAWEMNVATQHAEADIDLLQYLWEGGAITLDVTTGERTLPLGTPTAYRQRRLVVAFQRQSTDGGVTPGGIRTYCFRLVQKSPQESTINHNKTGEQVSIPYQWRCLADQAVSDPYARFGSIIDEV